jgi:hypothetical protein
MQSLRDTPVGQLFRATGFKAKFAYPEEEPGFDPEQRLPTAPKDAEKSSQSDANTSDADTHSPTPGRKTSEERTPGTETDNTVAQDAAKTEAGGRDLGLIDKRDELVTDIPDDVILVEWSDPKDPLHPRNWSWRKKMWTVFLIKYGKSHREGTSC